MPFLFFIEMNGTRLASLAFNPDSPSLRLIVCTDISLLRNFNNSLSISTAVFIQSISDDLQIDLSNMMLVILGRSDCGYKWKSPIFSNVKNLFASSFTNAYVISDILKFHFLISLFNNSSSFCWV